MLLRNSEVKNTLFIEFVLTAIAIIICLPISQKCAMITGIFCFVLIVINLYRTKRSYDRIASLADDINRILSGSKETDLRKYSEGELGILESELTKLMIKLNEHSEHMKKDKLMLTDSIADISHQLRTPLTSLNLIATALRVPDISEEKRMSLVIKMTQQLNRIDWLISALLKLAQLDADAAIMTPVSILLKELIKAASEPLKIPMELRDQTIDVQADGFVTCDLSWTAEAIGNVLKNCMEHMQSGTIHICACENPLFSEIIITDEGSGIDEKDLPHLFERFYRGKNSTSNSVGIGLALSRQILSKQNATIKAENARSGGAQFTIRFYKSFDI